MGENSRLFEIVDELKRLERLLDDKSLAEIAGIQRSTLSMIRNGKQRVSLELLRTLKVHFPDISLDYIIVGTGQPFIVDAMTGTPHSGSDNPNSVIAMLLDQLKSVTEENGALKRDLSERKSGKHVSDADSEATALAG